MREGCELRAGNSGADVGIDVSRQLLGLQCRQTATDDDPTASGGLHRPFAPHELGSTLDAPFRFASVSFEEGAGLYDQLRQHIAMQDARIISVHLTVYAPGHAAASPDLLIRTNEECESFGNARK
jgi:hypothetical protein